MLDSVGLNDLKSVFSWLPALVSVFGAVASWYWSKKRMRFDLAKELGTLRADTMDLLEKSTMLDNQKWLHNFGR